MKLFRGTERSSFQSFIPSLMLIPPHSQSHSDRYIVFAGVQVRVCACVCVCVCRHFMYYEWGFSVRECWLLVDMILRLGLFLFKRVSAFNEVTKYLVWSHLSIFRVYVCVFGRWSCSCGGLKSLNTCVDAHLKRVSAFYLFFPSGHSFIRRHPAVSRGSLPAAHLLSSVKIYFLW